MDKVLAFSILSASPADIAAGAGLSTRWPRLSWRRSAGDRAEPTAKQQQRGKEQGSGPRADGEEPASGGTPFLPRFAPEFDGIGCFETIVSH